MGDEDRCGACMKDLKLGELTPKHWVEAVGDLPGFFVCDKCFQKAKKQQLPWVCSLDGERFESEEYATREDAIEDFMEELRENGTECGGFYVARSIPFDFEAIEAMCEGLADSVLDSLGDQMYDEVADLSDGWPSADPFDIKRLNQELARVIAEWVMKNCPPLFSKYIDVEYIGVEPEPDEA